MVWVKFNYLPNDFEGDWEINLYHFCIDIRNVPELIKGIFQVFYGDIDTMAMYNIKGHNDSINMRCNYEMVSPSELVIYNNRTDTGFEDQYLDFLFSPNQIPRSPVKSRIPTPAMVWATDTLKKIYDEWKDKNKAAVA